MKVNIAHCLIQCFALHSGYIFLELSAVSKGERGVDWCFAAIRVAGRVRDASGQHFFHLYVVLDSEKLDFSLFSSLVEKS